jgi:hypothetical protein
MLRWLEQKFYSWQMRNVPYEIMLDEVDILHCINCKVRLVNRANYYRKNDGPRCSICNFTYSVNRFLKG